MSERSRATTTRLRAAALRLRSGYSGLPLWQKLGLKPGLRVRLIDSPIGYWELAEFDPSVLAILGPRARNPDFVHLFATRRVRLAAWLGKALVSLPQGAVLWLSWPKAASGVETDIDENVLRELVLPRGWVDVKVCAVDATWSALKFLRRKTPSGSKRG